MSCNALLDRDGRIGRHTEHCRAVLFDRHRPQNALDVPRAFHTHHALRPAHPRVQVMVTDQAQPLDRPARNPLQTTPGIDVGQEVHRVLAAQVHLVGNHRRERRLAQRDGLQQGLPGQFLQQQHAVEHIHQVNPPERLRRLLGRHQEVLLAQGIGMQELGPGGIHQIVGDDGLDLLAPARNPLHRPLGLAPAPGHIKQHQFAHPRHPVMAPHDAYELGRVPRDRLGIEHRVRPVRIAAVELHLLRPVGVHVEQQPVVRVRCVGVLPAQVQHPAVFQHRGAPVVLLVEAELADVAPIGIHPVQVRHPRAAIDARHGCKRGGRGEDDPPVGQIAGVVMVHVGRIAGRYLAQPGAIHADLEDVPLPMAADRGEQQPVRIEVQVHVADEIRPRRPVQGAHRAVRLQAQERDFVIETRRRQCAIALPVLRQAQRGACGAPPHDE